MHFSLIGSLSATPATATLQNAARVARRVRVRRVLALEIRVGALERDVEVAEVVAEGEGAVVVDRVVVVGDGIVGILVDGQLGADLGDADAGSSVSGSPSTSTSVPSCTSTGPMLAVRPTPSATSLASASAFVVSRTTTSGVRSSLIGMARSSCARTA